MHNLSCRRALCHVAAVTLVLGLALVASSPPGAAEEPPIRGVTWAAIGDSYASGEGIAGTGIGMDICARSELAYGIRAANLLREQRSWDITLAPLVACTGAVSPDINGPSGHTPPLPSQWDQTAQPNGRFDVINLSMGGNDIGFPDIMKGCLAFNPDGHIPGSWAELGRGDFVRQGRCDISPSEVAEFALPLLREHQVPDGRTAESLADLYAGIVRNRLTDDGILVVAGYPRIFAPVEQWPEWRGRTCEYITKTDADMLNTGADELDAVIRRAVDRSGVGDRIVYVSRLDLFDNAGKSHSLCGQPTTEWINGVSLGTSAGLRFAHSFHPNEPGHAATAELVASTVDGILGERLAPTTTTSDAPSDTAPPPTSPPITSGDRLDIGDRFSMRCTVAWPTAPTRSTQGIQMRTFCPGLSGQFQFVDILYEDPDLPVTPSRATMQVEGEIADVAESELGFKILVVLADDIVVL